MLFHHDSQYYTKMYGKMFKLVLGKVFLVFLIYEMYLQVHMKLMMNQNVRDRSNLLEKESLDSEKEQAPVTLKTYIYSLESHDDSSDEIDMST